MIKAYVFGELISDASLKKTIEKIAEDSSRVKECYGLSGSHDLVIKVQTEDLDKLTAFVYDLWRYGLYQTTTYIVKEKFHKLNKEGTQKAAFVFIRSLPDHRLNIIDEISELDCVDEVSAVFGDQDIIVEVNEASKNEIYPKIVEELRLLDDISSSETLITVYP